MQSDFTLLELAAKAAGLPWDQWVIDGEDSWNSLADDGDCARLEAACDIEIEWCRLGVIAKRLSPITAGNDIRVRVLYADHGGDKNKARRYASTRVAARLARAAQEEV
jgi:hypothetical protein